MKIPRTRAPLGHNHIGQLPRKKPHGLIEAIGHASGNENI